MNNGHFIDFMHLPLQVLALGAPYPLVVLPVEGDYWMEGTNHILQRDTHNRPMIPVVDLSRCIVESDHTASAYRENFLGKVCIILKLNMNLLLVDF